MSPKPDPIRPLIRALEPSGITKVTALGLGDPDVLALWFGETDLVTPPFIREAAINALEDGKTFYTNARGILPLRQAIAAFHKRTLDIDIDIARITIPGAAMLAVTTALQAVAIGLLEDHLGHCVTQATEQGGPDAQDKVREAAQAISRLVRS